MKITEIPGVVWRWFVRLPTAMRLGLLLGSIMLSGLFLQSRLTLDAQFGLIEEQFQQSGLNTSTQLAESAMEPLFTDDLQLLERLTLAVQELEQVSGAAILALDGSVLAETGIVPPPHLATAIINSNKSSLSWRYSVNDELLTSFVVPIAFKNVQGGHALVVMSRQSIELVLAKVNRGQIISTLLVAILALLSIVFTSQILVRPLRALVEGTKALADGKFEHRIHGEYAGEFKQLIHSFNGMAESLHQKWQMEKVLNSLVPTQVSKQYMALGKDVELGSKKVNATVLFADLAGFTALAEKISAETLEKVLNQTFTLISEIAQKYDGFVDKYIGDEAMLVFGIPDQTQDHTYRAFQAAIEIQQGISRQVHYIEDQPIRVRLKIGINSGEVLAGLFGAESRMEYTIIGDPVNVASRITAECKPGQILTTAELAEKVGKEHGIYGFNVRTIQLKGKQAREQVSEIVIPDIIQLPTSKGYKV